MASPKDYSTVYRANEHGKGKCQGDPLIDIEEVNTSILFEFI